MRGEFPRTAIDGGFRGPASVPWLLLGLGGNMRGTLSHRVPFSTRGRLFVEIQKKAWKVCPLRFFRNSHHFSSWLQGQGPSLGTNFPVSVQHWVSRRCRTGPLCMEGSLADDSSGDRSGWQNVSDAIVEREIGGRAR